MVRQQARIYSNAHQAMFTLGASKVILMRYQILSKEHLKVSSIVADPNGRGH
ncbi:hypothetical protein F5I97DRAFT_1799318 [Phlebopus sp. FC_14]|nr:hypothetical protein F5I97DRAFT_1799318 [Phlebopus sp. FC_14]